MTTETPEWLSPSENPGVAESVVAEAMQPEIAPKPNIAEPVEAFVRLPAGLDNGDAKPLKEVEVKELDGFAEEKLAKVSQSTEPGRWLQTLLECGVESIGGVKATPDMLKGLLIGDRDYLVLAIRHATYGPVVEYGKTTCPVCDESYELSVDIRDVPVRPLEGDRSFEVPFKDGGSALVRYPDGNDQLEFFEDLEASEAQRRSTMLAQCVIALTDKHGNTEPLAGFPSLVKAMSIPKRDAVVKAISEKQPGPRYDEVVFKHDCGHERQIPMGLMHLFPGL